MNIFVIRKEEFLKNVDKKTFEGKFKSSKRDIEYTLGHFLVKFVATNFYNAEDVSIYEINKKPKFKNSALNFSISHSNNLICTAFDEEFDLKLKVLGCVGIYVHNSLIGLLSQIVDDAVCCYLICLIPIKYWLSVLL